MTARPRPEVTAETEPYWQALGEGTLSFQRCATCGNAWLPARSECPRCLGPDWSWEPSTGTGRLISWVVYHTSYHPYFEDKLPYTVGVVELEEGPRLIAGLVDPPADLRIDQQLVLRPTSDEGQPLAMFVAGPQ